MPNLLRSLVEFTTDPAFRDRFRSAPAAETARIWGHELTGEDVHEALRVVEVQVQPDLADRIEGRRAGFPSLVPSFDETPFDVAVRCLHWLADALDGLQSTGVPTGAAAPSPAAEPRPEVSTDHEPVPDLPWAEPDLSTSEPDLPWAEPDLPDGEPDLPYADDDAESPEPDLPDAVDELTFGDESIEPGLPYADHDDLHDDHEDGLPHDHEDPDVAETGGSRTWPVEEPQPSPTLSSAERPLFSVLELVQLPAGLPSAGVAPGSLATVVAVHFDPTLSYEIEVETDEESGGSLLLVVVDADQVAAYED